MPAGRSSTVLAAPTSLAVPTAPMVPAPGLVPAGEEHLDGVDVPWLFVYTVGEAARALGAAAADPDASLIAVGPRHHGLSGWMNELVGGSVAGRLAHTQHRPVTIVSAGRQERV